VAEEQLLTVPEVARRLRISEETVRRWLRGGKLKGIRLATERAGWRIPASEVAAMLAVGKQLGLPEGDDQKKAFAAAA